MVNYHEQESIVLKASREQERRKLNSYLRQRGFKSMDDFYELFRRDQPKRWQAEAVMDFTIFRSGATVYETSEDVGEGKSKVWDELHCDYLMATLPRENIDLMITEIMEISAAFDLQVYHNQEMVTGEELRSRLNRIADELTGTVAGPGSEELAILVKLEYQRRRGA